VGSLILDGKMLHAKSAVTKSGAKRISSQDLRCLTWQDLLARWHQSFEKLELDQVLLICFVDDLFVVLNRKDVLIYDWS
jgi:hypothetical protein